MIVQEASLCSGSLRDALDISQEIGEHSAGQHFRADDLILLCADDYEIYAALRKVHLLPGEGEAESLEKSAFANLDSFVAIGGNWSAVNPDLVLKL